MNLNGYVYLSRPGKLLSPQGELLDSAAVKRLFGMSITRLLDMPESACIPRLMTIEDAQRAGHITKEPVRHVRGLRDGFYAVGDLLYSYSGGDYMTPAGALEGPPISSLRGIQCTLMGRSFNEPAVAAAFEIAYRRMVASMRPASGAA